MASRVVIRGDGVSDAANKAIQAAARFVILAADKAKFSKRQRQRKL